MGFRPKGPLMHALNKFAVVAKDPFDLSFDIKCISKLVSLTFLDLGDK